MDLKLATLESTSSTEVKLAPTRITTSFSTNALSKKYLRNASSLRSPRKSWRTRSLMLDRMHSMVPDSCQNLRLSLPVDWSVSPDWKFDQVNVHAVHQVLIAISNDANESQNKCQGLHLDVERLNIGKASENTGNHFGIITDPETHFQCQNPHTWYHGAWAHPCPALQLQSKSYTYYLEAPYTPPQLS
jgi:hypothetical protein